MRHILTTILSPMIGGFAMVSIGAFYTYLFDAVSFFISLLFLLGVNYKRLVGNEPETQSKSIVGEIIEGYRYIKSRQEIFCSYASDFIVMVLCNPVALYPALAAAFQQEKSVGIALCFSFNRGLIDDFNISLDTIPYTLWSFYHCLSSLVVPFISICRFSFQLQFDFIRSSLCGIFRYGEWSFPHVFME